ncbi:hypothetical protein [Methanothrix sp.]|uniref:hypothetical protein n=1 Tax=Methanothrix sp. TaxID=90426 RepID=UPI003C77E4A3
MIELAEKEKYDPKAAQRVYFEHTCGAEDQRDCIMMKHIIMAELRKSNVPLWVSEELEKKFECLGCWDALRRRTGKS